MGDYISDKHTLYITFLTATVQQIESVFRIAFNQYCEMTNNSYEYNLILNYVENKKGESQGFAFVYVPDTEFYNRLFPDCDPKNRIKIQSILLDDFQVEQLKERGLNDKLTTELKISKAVVLTEIEDKFVPNILKLKNKSYLVDKNDIYNLFKPFSSNEKYPVITPGYNGTFFIKFDKDTHDAQFALHMRMKTVLTKQVNDHMEDILLLFSHSYVRDSDVIKKKQKTFKKKQNHKTD